MANSPSAYSFRIRLANWISGHVNHYDHEFPVSAVPEVLTTDWLDATEAKCREGLGDRFVDDACAVMLAMVGHCRALQSKGVIVNGHRSSGLPFASLRLHVSGAQELLGEDGYVPSLQDLDAASGHLADALNVLDDELPDLLRAAVRQAWEKGVRDAEEAAAFVGDFLSDLAKPEVRG